MSERQWKRWDVIERVDRGKLSLKQAAKICGISERRLRRIRTDMAEMGKEALIHGNRGRSPTNRIEDVVRDRVIELRKTKCDRFNDQHFTEKLWEETEETPPVKISPRSVRRILQEFEVIYALSPQAKGRVERANQTLQDRLVKELRLHGISTMEDGNAFLSSFRDDFDQRFGREPLNHHDAHRALRGPTISCTGSVLQSVGSSRRSSTTIS